MRRRFILDIEKLFGAIEGKRKQHNLSRERIAARYGLPKSSLNFYRSKSLDAKVLIPVLMYLDRPITDFVKTVEEEEENGIKDGK